MPFLMQVVLLGFISTTSCVFRLPVSPPGLPPAYLTNKPPLLFTDENDECQAEPDPPPSVADHFIAWQPRTSTSAASLQKPPSPGGQLGHATASNADHENALPNAGCSTRVHLDYILRFPAARKSSRITSCLPHQQAATSVHRRER
ncbi:hypothetical protein MRX96_016683 [Rhipicephalus microplus]